MESAVLLQALHVSQTWQQPLPYGLQLSRICICQFFNRSVVFGPDRHQQALLVFWVQVGNLGLQLGEPSGVFLLYKLESQVSVSLGRLAVWDRLGSSISVLESSDLLGCVPRISGPTGGPWFFAFSVEWSLLFRHLVNLIDFRLN